MKTFSATHAQFHRGFPRQGKTGNEPFGDRSLGDPIMGDRIKRFHSGGEQGGYSEQRKDPLSTLKSLAEHYPDIYLGNAAGPSLQQFITKENDCWSLKVNMDNKTIEIIYDTGRGHGKMQASWDKTFKFTETAEAKEVINEIYYEPFRNFLLEAVIPFMGRHATSPVPKRNFHEMKNELLELKRIAEREFGFSASTRSWGGDEDALGDIEDPFFSLDLCQEVNRTKHSYEIALGKTPEGVYINVERYIGEGEAKTVLYRNYTRPDEFVDGAGQSFPETQAIDKFALRHIVPLIKKYS